MDIRYVSSHKRKDTSRIENESWNLVAKELICTLWQRDSVSIGN